MNTIELSVIPRVALLLAILSLSTVQLSAVRADVAISSGTFVDSKGQLHLWHVNDKHTLLWGGRPWIPAGGLFQSRYLTGPQTDQNWAADQADLMTLKQHGITSIILVANAELDPITDIPPADLQKVLDYLDAEGFKYGLTLSSFPRTPVEATIVNPAIYRVAAPSPGSVAYFRNLPGLTGATYFLVSEADGSIIATGNATVIDSQSASVTVSSTQGGPGTVLLLYPKRLFLPDSIEGKHLPDIWGQTDDYRDSLLLYFSHIKFGSGLRFFLDPAVAGLSYYGDADSGAIPDGDGYRFQFEVWLENKYGKSLPRLNSSWGVKNGDIFDFAAASRCVPLWFQSKGVQLLVDPLSRKTFEATAQSSQFWTDVKAFRADSMRDMMNGLALAIKNGIADVPVVYRWTRPSSLYVDQSTSNGYDGLMVSSPEHGDNLSRNAAGWALAEAEESNRTLWLTGQILPTGVKAGDGYVSRSDLETDKQALQSLAVKGYFVDSFRRLTDVDDAGGSLLDAPVQQLDWVHSDDANFSVSADDLADFLPNILYYPTNLNLPSTFIQQFDDGTWWLPSDHIGESIDIGRGLQCYSLAQPKLGSPLVLWSPDGTVKTAEFELPKNTKIVSTTPAGNIVTISLNKRVYTLQTSSTPLLVRGVATLPLVSNATILELAEAQRLIDEGTSQKIPMDVDQQRLYYIKNEVMEQDSATSEKIAYPLVVSLTQDMENELNPNAWVEGEDASQQSFGTVVASHSTSGGAFLWQDTANPPSTDAPYEATYTLNVGAPGDYTVWAAIAPGPPGTGTTSPLSFSLDSGTQYDVGQAESQGMPYGSVLDAATATKSGSFCWYRLGVLTLTSGPHAINFFLTGPAPTTHRFTMGIDAICLSRGSFHPDGPNKPLVN